METTDRLLAIEQIRQTKARYFRFIDTKDRDGLASVFSADAVLDHTDAEMDEPVRGRDAIADFITGVLVGVTTVHHGHMAEVERNWFRRRFAALDAPAIYYTDEDPDGDFQPSDRDTLAGSSFLLDASRGDRSWV